jgi:hypothetical protein
MFTEGQILEIIKQKIAADEKLGEQSGGSGHLGFVSYDIKDYKTKQISPEQLEISYQYCIYVETEFTSYPDNPPLEYHLEKVIVVNRDKEILSES